MKNKKDTKNWIKIRAVCARCGTDLTYKVNPEDIWEQDYKTKHEEEYIYTEHLLLCPKCDSVWCEEEKKRKKEKDEWDAKFFE